MNLTGWGVKSLNCKYLLFITNNFQCLNILVYSFRAWSIREITCITASRFTHCIKPYSETCLERPCLWKPTRTYIHFNLKNLSPETTVCNMLKDIFVANGWSLKTCSTATWLNTCNIGLVFGDCEQLTTGDRC